MSERIYDCKQFFLNSRRQIPDGLGVMILFGDYRVLRLAETLPLNGDTDAEII